MKKLPTGRMTTKQFMSAHEQLLDEDICLQRKLHNGRSRHRPDTPIQKNPICLQASSCKRRGRADLHDCSPKQPDELETTPLKCGLLHVGFHAVCLLMRSFQKVCKPWALKLQLPNALGEAWVPGSLAGRQSCKEPA